MTLVVPTWVVILATIGYALSFAGALVRVWERFSGQHEEITTSAALFSLGASLMGVAMLVSELFFRK